MRVDVLERGRDLEDNVADLLMTEWVVVQLTHLHHAVEIHVKQLKQHEETILMANDLHTVDNIGMLESDHSFDLCVSHGLFPAGKLALELLERICLLSFLVAHLVYHAKGPFS